MKFHLKQKSPPGGRAGSRLILLSISRAIAPQASQRATREGR
jgi:hypothetical protein